MQLFSMAACRASAFDRPQRFAFATQWPDESADVMANGKNIMTYRYAAAVIGALILLVPVASAAPQDPPLCRGCPTAAEAKRLADFLAKQSPPPIVKEQVVTPPPVVEPPPPPPPPPVIAPATPATVPPVTQNTVATTGPVTSETTISVGTLAGQALAWIA